MMDDPASAIARRPSRALFWAVVTVTLLEAATLSGWLAWTAATGAPAWIVGGLRLSTLGLAAAGVALIARDHPSEARRGALAGAMAVLVVQLPWGLAALADDLWRPWLAVSALVTLYAVRALWRVDPRAGLWACGYGLFMAGAAAWALAT